MLDNSGLITIAIGKKYVNQAKYLAYSCMIHSPHITRSVITDRPSQLSSLYDIIIPFAEKKTSPFSLKLYLHHYTPFSNSLFLDADSLITGNIDFLFDYIKTSSFAYFANLIKDGEWYTNIKQLLQIINVSEIPKINSGMFLFKNNKISAEIFNTAINYLLKHKEMGLDIPYFRENMYPDEPFLSMSLAKNNIVPVNDHGRFSRSLIKAKNIKINTIKGISSFFKDNKTVFPLIVHFCGRKGGLYYLREKLRLFFYFFPFPL
jgi:hypothetical protein